MPTKRRPRDRRWRGRFSAETLALFRELELVPKRKRGSEEFRAAEKQLMCKYLGLSAEYWTMVSVLDDSAGPNCSPDRHRYTCWIRCREVRLELLKALAESLRDAPAQAPLVH